MYWIFQVIVFDENKLLNGKIQVTKHSLQPSHMTQNLFEYSDIYQSLVSIVGSEFESKVVNEFEIRLRYPSSSDSDLFIPIGTEGGTNFIKETALFKYPISPLKQIQSGIDLSKIQCKENLVLLQKYDGSPACVGHDTKPRLIDRGWMQTKIDVFNETEFIESAKMVKASQIFLSHHPDAKITVDYNWFLIKIEESGYRQHPSSSIIQHTKRLSIGLDYERKPTAQSLECGGPVSLVATVNVTKLASNPDWCFPLDQSPFQNLKDRN